MKALNCFMASLANVFDVLSNTKNKNGLLLQAVYTWI